MKSIFNFNKINLFKNFDLLFIFKKINNLNLSSKYKTSPKTQKINGEKFLKRRFFTISKNGPTN